jgi:hypothetical protein
MDTAVFHNLAPDTNRIAHATRGHLVALLGCTCKCGNFSIPNNAKCLVICMSIARIIALSVQRYGISLKETIFSTLVIELLSEFI